MAGVQEPQWRMRGICAVAEGPIRPAFLVEGTADAFLSSERAELGEQHSAQTKQHVVPELDHTKKVSRSSLFISLQREAMNLRFCCCGRLCHSTIGGSGLEENTNNDFRNSNLILWP